MDNLKEKISELLDKINIHEFEDVFPLNSITYDIKNVVRVVGIYIAAMAVVGLLILLLGGIPVLGVIIKIISVIVGIYAVVGIVGVLLNFMKYN